jgi:hypothetical protein
MHGGCFGVFLLQSIHSWSNGLSEIQEDEAVVYHREQEIITFWLGFLA